MAFTALPASLTSALSLTRSAQPIITVNHNDVTSGVYPSLESLTFKEGLVFTADTVSIKLADPEGKFRLTWKIKTAMPLQLTIQSHNWNFPGETLQKQCGTFYIHRVTMESNKGSGTTIALEATSTPATPKCSVRLERKSKGTAKTTLKALAGQIATSNGLQLQYLAPENPKIGRDDQHDQSDLVHLGKHCEENDLILKIKDNALWIQSHEQLEKQAPVGIIVCPTPGNPGGINGQGMVSWRLEENLEDIYAACEVAYKDHKTGKVVRATVKDPDHQDIGNTHRVKTNPKDQENTDEDESDETSEVDK